MSEIPSDFWHPGKERRPWVEKLPTARKIGNATTYEAVSVAPIKKKPKIFDQFGRPIKPEVPPEQPDQHD